MKTDLELTQAYHSATSSYEAAKAGTGDRLNAFTRLMDAERVLTTRVGYGFDRQLQYYREHHSV